MSMTFVASLTEKWRNFTVSKNQLRMGHAQPQPDHRPTEDMARVKWWAVSCSPMEIIRSQIWSACLNTASHKRHSTWSRPRKDSKTKPSSAINILWRSRRTRGSCKNTYVSLRPSDTSSWVKLQRLSPLLRQLNSFRIAYMDNSLNQLKWSASLSAFAKCYQPGAEWRSFPKVRSCSAEESQSGKLARSSKLLWSTLKNAHEYWHN